MTLEQKWIEHSYNPFILFSSEGKILSLNTEAQFLLGSVSVQELFELSKSYASISFGFKTSFLELEYGHYKFFGITVGYEDEDEIAISLYQAPSYKPKRIEPENGELTNIFTIIDLCIATHSINSKTNFKKDFDPTIPDIIIDTNALIKILNKIYDYIEGNETVETRVFLRIGEHIKYKTKKYSIVTILVNAQKSHPQRVLAMEAIAQNSSFYVAIQEKSVTLNLPMITVKQ
jgi:hypothetical protein